MKFILLAIVFISLMSNAFALNFECKVKHNHELALEARFEMTAKSSKKFGSFDVYEFTLRDTGHMFELELYNALEPSRTYALGNFQHSSDLGLIIWNREKLLEVNCKKSL
jgi:hypothetical protein